MRYLNIINGVLVPTTVKVEIDTSKYTIIEERRRFVVSQHEKGEKFLIDVGSREDNRVTIVCNDMGELIHALALVRAAFPVTRKENDRNS